MKKELLFACSAAAILFASCTEKKPAQYGWLKEGIDVATHQLMFTAEEIADSAKLPRSIWVGHDLAFLDSQLQRPDKSYLDSLRKIPTHRIGERRLTGVYDWTSGFFPGSLWFAYELTGDQAVKTQAAKFTNLLNPVREYTGTHDLGFMMYCSFGNAQRLDPNDTIPAVLVETAENLSKRFNPEIGAIRSWDFGTWNFPVIIDNMMNLDLLFFASRYTGNSKYKDLAITHANTTLDHHFREDASSYHVISYNNDGTPECKETFQGKNHESAWSRGQSWAIYGYTAAYRETNITAYLEFAQRVAKLIMDRTNTEDLIPYWDFDAPVGQATPRDASAAAVTAAAMFELSTMVEDGQKYFDYAERILKSLSSEAYLAKRGENQGFVLMHSTGSLPHGSEIDTPLNYADYYYLEAIQRYMNLKGLTYSEL